jgi:hypothetical protein
MSAIKLLLSNKTEKAGNELLEQHFNGSYIDSLENCLNRSEAMAGILSSFAMLSCETGFDMSAYHIQETARVLQGEIEAAQIILKDLYREARVLSENKGVL